MSGKHAPIQHYNIHNYYFRGMGYLKMNRGSGSKKSQL